MVNQPSLDLRLIIDVLRKENSTCYVRWQKVKLYDIGPWEFLSFARQDLEDDSERGIINALSNAKRAIECRADEILTLSNLKGFASRNRWGLRYKLLVLKRFGVVAPEVLTSYIASKRNILEHEYVRPKSTEESKYLADITELFLSATDKFVEKGYIRTATIGPEEDQPQGNVSSDTLAEYYEMYDLEFDLWNELIEVTYRHIERIADKETGLLGAKVNVLNERGVNIAIRDYKEQQVVELMNMLKKAEDWEINEDIEE